MTEHIRLTEQWGLRKLQLGDRCEWALQYLGMDWIRMCEFLPSKNAPMAMDDDIRKFAAAVAALSPPEPTEGIRATLLNIHAMAERGFPIDNAKLADRCRAALRAMPLQDHAPKESPPTQADLLAAAREAFLDLRADAQRWEEDVDGDTDSNGRMVVYVNYHATFGHDQLEALCEALGIHVPFGETAGDAIDRVIADGAAAMVAEQQTEAKS